MADMPPLSDLCRICNNNIPKYCCPRCRSLTCSLPCYKRHQKWSQCSGKRDPAAYMKRSQLATPAGIDHDYNFLTGIERAFDVAGRHAQSKGIRLEPRRDGQSGSSYKLHMRTLDAKVNVRKAPRGMSRQKENQTHCLNDSAHEAISWTVEWFLPDGSRKLKNCGEQSCIKDAFRNTFRGKPVSKSKRRKHKQDFELLGRDLESLNAAAAEPVPMQDPLETTAAAPADKEASSTELPTDLVDDFRSSVKDKIETNPLLDQSAQADKSLSSLEEAKLHFYLHRPWSSSSSRVLIPLSPNATLRESLVHRTVLEFPTIYVLQEPMTSLPEGFQLEDDYTVEARKMIKELNDEEASLLAQSIHATERDDAPVALPQEGFEHKILEIVRKDIVGL